MRASVRVSYGCLHPRSRRMALLLRQECGRRGQRLSLGDLFMPAIRKPGPLPDKEQLTASINANLLERGPFERWPSLTCLCSWLHRQRVGSLKVQTRRGF
jgi:hypothetical protein